MASTENQKIMNLPKPYWATILAGLSIPAILLLLKAKIAANAQHVVQHNPYANLKAFLIMIQYSEGTYGKDAYNMLYGGQLFTDYSDHPNSPVSKWGITSTAAGAYQILYRTWQGVQQSLGLQDFSPLSQDRAAIELIRRRGALDDALAGRFSIAVDKCRKEWASLPGAGYGQQERSLDILAMVYQQAGGQLIA